MQPDSVIAQNNMYNQSDPDERPQSLSDPAIVVSDVMDSVCASPVLESVAAVDEIPATQPSLLRRHGQYLAKGWVAALVSSPELTLRSVQKSQQGRQGRAVARPGSSISDPTQRLVPLQQTPSPLHVASPHIEVAGKQRPNKAQMAGRLPR